MKHADATELLAAHAIGAVHGHERDALDKDLHSCAWCRAEFADQLAVADGLSFGEDEPSPEIWGRIAAEITPRAPRAGSPSCRRGLVCGRGCSRPRPLPRLWPS